LKTDNKRVCVFCGKEKVGEDYDKYTLQHDVFLCCHYPSENDGDKVQGLACTECIDKVMLWLRTEFPKMKITNYLL